MEPAGTVAIDAGQVELHAVVEEAALGVRLFNTSSTKLA
jgi:hypothetical protein